MMFLNACGRCSLQAMAVFHHTVLLNFRPFAMFNTAWQRDQRNQSRRARKHDEGSQVQPEAPIPWIGEACGYAVQAAKDLLGLIVRSLESAPIVQVGPAAPS